MNLLGNKIKSFLISLSLFIVIFSFAGFSFGQMAPNYNPAGADSIVPGPRQSQDGGGVCPPHCGWSDLIFLFKRIIDFLFFISASLAVLGFAYAGFLYMTAFGNMGKIEQAHHMFTMILTGLFFVFCGWLLIATILKTLGVDQAYSLLDLRNIRIFEAP